MTARKSTLRPRKRASVENLPRSLAAWFSGEASETPLLALIYPDNILLPERWRAWKAAHPKARPPDGFAWLDDPASPQHPTAEQLEQVRALTLVDLP